jgi:hypothetical protein
MSDRPTASRIVDIDAWIARARRDPVAYLERQAIDVVLATIGELPGYRGRFFLKGGILMAVVYDSPRNTGDIDFTTNLPASPDLPAALRAALDRTFPKVTARLGYPDLMLKVQTMEERPRLFAGPGAHSFPALKIRIAYARRGEPGEQRLASRNASTVVTIEVSFNEPIGSSEMIQLSTGGSTVPAYSITDLVAEKFRALLQQVPRKRNRRQDVYDIAHLAERFPLDADERAITLATLKTKCQARGIAPMSNSLDDDELIARARAEWETLEQEIGDLPDFDRCFGLVRDLYRNLPWT